MQRLADYDPGHVPDFHLYMEDYDPESDERFVTKVLKPYFKDIYNDLKLRAPSGLKGLDRSTF